ncbi:MAG TPA: VanZ family protein [Microbacteriaceae bacterium]|jgi:glycopeptide antibiotics resistance protein|nr:VanZ family protein [Microbacteriaceae bacterium]
MSVESRARGMILGILTAFVAVILAITFWPTPVDRPFDAQLMRILGTLHHAGVATWVDYSFVERLSNAIMFVPLGVLIALYFRRQLWWLSVALPFVLSVCIELGQGLFLPERTASVSDVIANTFGALIGGGAVAIIRFAVNAHRAPRPNA